MTDLATSYIWRQHEKRITCMLRSCAFLSISLLSGSLALMLALALVPATDFVRGDKWTLGGLADLVYLEAARDGGRRVTASCMKSRAACKPHAIATASRVRAACDREPRVIASRSMAMHGVLTLAHALAHARQSAANARPHAVSHTHAASRPERSHKLDRLVWCLRERAVPHALVSSRFLCNLNHSIHPNLTKSRKSALFRFQ